MAGVKEIKARIEGVQETRKITNAMYLVASTKLRHAREALDRTRPYFNATRREVARVFRSNAAADSRYFFREDGSIPRHGVCGVLVITADKGLAGSYNMNAIRKAEAILKEKPDARLFVVGEYGRRHFKMRKTPTEENFLYTAQDPTMDRARTICTLLLDLYDRKELNEIIAVYTDMQSSLSSTAQATRLLPLERSGAAGERKNTGINSILTADPYAGSMIHARRDGASGGQGEANGTADGAANGPGPNGTANGTADGASGGQGEANGTANGPGPNGTTNRSADGAANRSADGAANGTADGAANRSADGAANGDAVPEYLFLPSSEAVLGAVMRSYISGFLYSAMVDSFCCEQNARVTAMDAAGRNAGELLDSLSLQLNRERQGAITQEITEISAGAKAQRKKKQQ